MQDFGAAEPASLVADVERTEDSTGIAEALLRERGQGHLLVSNAGGPAAGYVRGVSLPVDGGQLGAL